MSDPVRGEVREAAPEGAFAELSALKAAGFNVLVDLTCLDRAALGLSPRFLVLYRLARIDPETGLDGGRVELRVPVGEEPALRSAVPLWPAADWLEREVWDMFGVGFVDRPGIKRLLMYESFSGHPLRKDYPIARRQPLVGPADGRKADAPSFNIERPSLAGE